MGWAEQWHRGHARNPEERTGECLFCPPSPKQSPFTQAFRHSALHCAGSDGHFPVRTAAETAAFLTLTPVPLPHTVFTLISLCTRFSSIPIFIWKLQNVFSVHLSQEKSRGLPLIPIFLWVSFSVGNLYLFHTFLSLITFLQTVDVSFTFWLTHPFLF